MGMKGVSVVFHGQEHAMDVDVTSTSCNEFLQLLVAALHKANLQLAVHTLKLLVPKKGILQLDKQPHMPLSDAGNNSICCRCSSNVGVCLVTGNG